MISLPITVVIPCYKSASTISRAIDSILKQTALPKEVIIVDDYSNDGGLTIDTLKRIQQSSSLVIEVISLDCNVGPGSARNVGWESATQPYIAFLDADDSWHPEKLRTQYQWMVSHPHVALSGHASVMLNSQEEPQVFDGIVGMKKVSWLALLLFNYFPTRTVLLKREIPFRFLSGKRYAEDYLLWLMIVLNHYPAYFLNLPMAYTYKEDFGESGLNGHLLKSHLGVIDTFKRLLNLKLIGLLTYILVSIFAYIKFSRRLIIAFIRYLKK